MNEYDGVLGSLPSLFVPENADIIEVNGNEISIEQLPETISLQYNDIIKLEDSVVRSIQLARGAENSAKKASDFTVSWYGGRKEAIELLQDASKYSSQALISLAEAQRKSFEYQSKLSEITKSLFALGVGNIAMNRCVVSELEQKLNGCTGDDISELAKQELRNVILQLRTQEDLMQKQASIDVKVKEINGRLCDCEAASEEQEKKIDENKQDIKNLESMNKNQDELIATGIVKDCEHDKRILKNTQDIDVIEQKNEEQDDKINDFARKLDSHSEQTLELEQKIQDVSKNTVEMITDTKECISELDDTIEAQVKDINAKIEKLENRINSLEIVVSEKNWKVVVSIVAGVSLLLNVLQFFGIL